MLDTIPIYFLFSFSILVFGQTLDHITTARGLPIGCREANPVPAWLFKKLGNEHGLLSMWFIEAMIILLVVWVLTQSASGPSVAFMLLALMGMSHSVAALNNHMITKLKRTENKLFELLLQEPHMNSITKMWDNINSDLGFKARRWLTRGSNKRWFGLYRRIAA